MKLSSDRQDAVNDLLVKLEPQFEEGHIDKCTFDFVEFEPGDNRPVVDANGEFVLLAQLSINSLVYEKTIVEDVIKGLRDTAAQLKRVEFDIEAPAKGEVAA